VAVVAEHFAFLRWWRFSTSATKRSTADEELQPVAQSAGARAPLQLGASEELAKLERNLNWLATVASVSPFIGLLGTVVGIIDAFQALGLAGSASLRAVAPVFPRR
jgi:biopolymer transport protein ExbB/TolQ